MRKPEIKDVVNGEHALWLYFEPDALVLESLDVLVRRIDERQEGILPEEHVPYGEFAPRRLAHFNDDGLYAFSIFAQEGIDFIVLKDHPAYPAIGALLKKFFELPEEFLHAKMDGESHVHGEAA